MRTFKFTLEVFEDGKPVLNLHADETALKAIHVRKIIDVLFDYQEVIPDVDSGRDTKES